MRRTFPIAIAGLTGCGSFQFEGVWNVSKIEGGYVGSTETQSQDYPYVFSGTTETLSLEADASKVTLTQTYTYDNGDPTYVYNDGPYDWVETDKGMFDILGAFDATSFTCEGDKSAPDDLDCSILYADVGPNGEDGFADLTLNRTGDP